MTNRLPLCLETNYPYTTNVDNAFQVPTCMLHLYLEQLLRALHPTSPLQDLYYMISAMSIVMESPYDNYNMLEDQLQPTTNE